jgi:hypothetical protein
MTAQFKQDGIQFLYPENWEMDRQDTDGGWTVSVQSPETAFFMLSYDADMPEPERMADTALEALRSEYPGLESDEAVESLAGQPAVGHDVRFFSMDLTNTCWLRSFYGGSGTVLVMWEANDLELDRLGPVLRAMCASIKLEEE